MLKTKIIAVLLSITTVFTVFMGVSFAESGDGTETLVIENGKLISGSSELIDSGYIVLSSPDEEQAEENTDSSSEEDVKFVLDSFKSMFKDVNNGGSGGVTVPQQTPSAVSPSAPTESESAIPAINHAINITNPGTKYCASTNGITSLGCFTFSGTVGDTTSTSTGTLNKNASVTFAVLYNINYQIAINSAKTLELSYCRETHGSDNYATYRVPRGLYRVKTQGRYMFNLTNGGTLRIVGGINGQDTEEGTFKVGNDYDKFVIDANGGGESNSSTSSGNAPAFYVNNSTLEIKNAIIRDSLSGTSNGKGAAIHVTNGGKVYLENVVFDNCAMSGGTGGTMGGVIHIASGTVTLKNCRITNRVSSRTNFAQNGGAISILEGATSASGSNYLLQIEDTIIEKCRSTSGASSTDGGGAIYVGTLASTQKISIKNSTIQNCYTPGNGGAIHMESGGSLEMEDTTISNCYSTLAEVENSGTAAGGGGMYIDTTGTVSMTNCTVQNCYAQNGDGGGMFVDSATMTLTGCTINNNYITDTSSTYSYTLNSATVNLCAPLKTGAAIYAQNDANITLTNTKVNNNQQGAAKYARGAVYITRRSTVTMNGTSEISNNKGGGGVYIYSKGTFVMDGGTMSGNEYIYHNPTYGLSGYSIGNYGMSNGVAVLLHAENATNYGTFKMNGGTIKNHTNKTSLMGGAVGAMDGGTIEINGGNIESNTASTSTTFKTRSGTTVTYSTANSKGGAIYVEKGVAAGTLTMTGGTIGGTTATKGNSAGFGGGIYAGSGCDVHIKAGTIEYNSASVSANGGGGGVSVNDPSHFFIGDENNAASCPQIKNNTSVCDGGGVYAINSGIIIFNGEITGNSSKHGGGVYVTNASGSYTVTMHKGNIDNNESSGVFLAGGNGATSFIMNGGSISGNTIVKTGGHDYGGAGICALDGHSVTINGGTINGNKNLDEDVISNEEGDTARNGGGIAMVQKSSGVGTLTITGGTISNNETTGNGGGIYSEDGGIVSIKGTAAKRVTISGNKASTSGGGIYLNANKGTATAGSTVTIQYADINENKALDNDGDGGGIYSRSTNLSLSNCTFRGNQVLTTKSNGGGIDFGSAGYRLDVDKCLFTSNDAFWGGAMYFSNAVTVAITNSEFYSNTARQGGGLMIYGGTITASGCYFGGNQTTTHGSYAPDAGGAISVSGATLTIGSSNIGWKLENGEMVEAPNVSALGGGIYVYGDIDSKPTNSKLVLNSGMNISNNRATGGGGGVCFGLNANIPEFAGVILNNNQAGGNGGGIYATRTTASNTEGQRLTLSYCTMEGNTSDKNGGAVYAANTVLTVNNGEGAGLSVMRGNKAGGSGGAVYLINNTGAATGVTNFFKLSGTLYENNESNTDSTGEDGFGGAVYVANGNGYVANNEFYGNSVKASPANDSGVITDGNGGAVYVSGTSAVNSLFEFSINTVGDKDKGNTADNLGGGLCIGPYTKAAILRGYFQYNTANLGGGLHAADCVGGLLITPYTDEMKTHLGYTTIYSGVDKLTVVPNEMFTTVQGNSTRDNGTWNTNGGNDGGGIYFGTNATVKNLRLLDNHAGFDGGGMCIQGGKTVTLSGVNTIQGNNAANYGGGIIIRNGASLTINGAADKSAWTAINSNYLTGGAGIHVALNSVLEMSYGEIRDNDTRASDHGGGIDITGGTAEISNVAITGNIASYGGGVFVDDYLSAAGAFTASSCVITGNTAKADGGGINVYANSTAVLTNVAICDNATQNGSGAGVYVADNSSVTVNGGYIVGNNAGGSFTGNTTMDVIARGVGGGVAVMDNGVFALNLSGKNGAIYGNTASVGGADVFANGNGTRLTIPAAAAMDLDGAVIGESNVPAYAKDVSKSAWWEDYKTGDNNYTNGLAGDIPPAFRYADGPVSVRAYVTDAEGTSPSGRYVNDEGAFVSITFDVQKYNVGSIIITAPASADADQRFVFTVTGTTIRNETVSFTLSLAGGETVKIENLYPGTYTVTQNTAWSWRYEIDGLTLDGVSQGKRDAVQVQIKGTSVTEEYSVAYANTRTNNQWLSHNSPVESNKPILTAMARIDLAEGKRNLIF